MLRKLATTLAITICALATFLPAVAQAPAPVPALPDTERRTAYSITAQTGPFDVGFAVYGDGIDYANWIEVWLDGVRLTPITQWTLGLASGSLTTSARPLTNARVTLTTASTGTLQIVGARRPRRTAQFAENRGVAARDLNQALSDIISQNRETWDKINDVTGRAFLVPPGDILSVLPSAALRASQTPCFNSVGALALCQNLQAPIITGAGVDTNILATGTVIASAPTVDSTFCGKTAALGGSAFYTFTVGAASGFPINCSIVIANVDAGRGKAMAGFTLPAAGSGSIPNILWPTQAITLKNINNVWVPTGVPNRWKPAGSFTLNVNTVIGNNANDGLATGSAALASTAQCLAIIDAVFDLSGGFNTATCKLAAGDTDATLVHWSPHGGTLGALGGTQIIIDGSTTGTFSGGMQFYFGAVVKLQNLRLAAPGQICGQSNYGAHVDIGPNVIVGACPVGALDIQNGGFMQTNNQLFWSGSTPFLIAVQRGGIFLGNSQNVNLTQNVTVTATVASNFLSTLDAQGMSWTLNSFTVTGLRYACAGNAFIRGEAAIPGTGTSVTSGCQAI